MIQRFKRHAILDYVSPRDTSDPLIPRDTLASFLDSDIFRRSTPGNGNRHAHARRILRTDLKRWLRETDADGYPWGVPMQWNWEQSTGGPVEVPRRHRNPVRRTPDDNTPLPLYRADGAQTVDEIFLEYGVTPFSSINGLPSFWTPFRRVANVYASGYSQELWTAAIRPGHPFWLLRSRDCVDECQELLTIVCRFIQNCFGRHTGRRTTDDPAPGDVKRWMRITRGRTGWPGDLLAILLFMLRCASDADTVPDHASTTIRTPMHAVDFVILGGDWDTPEAQQTTSTTPGPAFRFTTGRTERRRELIVLHPRALSYVRPVEPHS